MTPPHRSDFVPPDDPREPLGGCELCHPLVACPYCNTEVNADLEFDHDGDALFHGLEACRHLTLLYASTVVFLGEGYDWLPVENRVFRRYLWTPDGGIVPVDRDGNGPNERLADYARALGCSRVRAERPTVPHSGVFHFEAVELLTTGVGGMSDGLEEPGLRIAVDSAATFSPMPAELLKEVPQLVERWWQGRNVLGKHLFSRRTTWRGGRTQLRLVRR